MNTEVIEWMVPFGVRRPPHVSVSLGSPYRAFEKFNSNKSVNKVGTSISKTEKLEWNQFAGVNKLVLKRQGYSNCVVEIQTVATSSQTVFYLRATSGTCG